MNCKSTYYKFIYNNKTDIKLPPGFVIIKNPILNKHMKDYYDGTLVYGSRREYKDSGKHFIFKEPNIKEELDPQWVLDNHFIGLI